jgi:hypothetical protein
VAGPEQNNGRTKVHTLTDEESHLGWEQQQKLIDKRNSAAAKSKYERFQDWWNGTGDLEDISDTDTK